MTASEQLEQVNAAIRTVLAGGQSYKIGSRSLTRANISELYEMKKQLESEAATDNNCGFGRGVAVGVFDGR